MNQFSSWSLGKKLAACLASVFALLLSLGVFSQLTISNLGHSQDKAINGLAKKITLAGMLNTKVQGARSAMRGLVLSAYTKEQSVADNSLRDFQAATAEYGKALEELRTVVDGASEQNLLMTLEQDMKRMQTVFSQVLTLCEKGQLEQAEHLRVGEFVPLVDEAEAAAESMRKEQIRDLTETDTASKASVDTSRLISMGLLLLSVVVFLAVFFIVRGATTGLNKVARQVAEQANQVSEVASQFSNTSHSLAQGASGQAAALEESSSSAEEIHAMAQRNSQHSQQAATLVGRSADTVTGANRALAEMVKAMAGIGASSQQISQIIKVIDDIAFQTNILALNAAVEAARAGEAGLGFAVVADEVRNLAQRCADAARQTTTLIGESLERTTEGKSTVARVDDAIRAITEDTGALRTIVNDLDTASQEQSRGIDQVSRAITQMQEVTQQTAASAEENAAASEELSAQARSIHAAVQALQAIVAGASK